ncbi:PTS sugar transporter subunit IIA [Streptococcus thoraltensis]|uniref:PTS sugar transporter subunit IIA n=1 Tax=Streptococcus thoraltensis TaxID=55085 RepID=UPI00037FDD42|nr:PTS sugar transporter subunit IIA [Streptococcus thoraltensis]MDY4761660.1 PTS sugar transporter subunit IIA [Streptococcus thoraltensis]
MVDFLLSGDLNGIYDKNGALYKVALFLSDKLEADTNVIFNSMVEREEISSTGLEKGIAVPHVFLTNDIVRDVHLAILTFDKSVIDWRCVDGSKVNKVFCLITPHSRSPETENVKRMISIMQSLASEKFTNSIESIKNSKDIVNILETYLIQGDIRR